jgi:2-oxopent-4-enoate/cis-2-oxohex-4-enoate hydratase
MNDTPDSAARQDPWDIPAIVAGMDKLLAKRVELIDDGAKPIGWKLAFGTEAAMSTLGTSGPLVGFLTDRTLIASGGECPITGWTAPKLEPEIAIHLGPGGEGVAGISPAIELADADLPPTETETVLAGDIYHRAVVLDRSATPTPPAPPLAARITRDGEAIAATDDGEAAVGKLDELAAYVVRYLREFGESTAEGEIIISGSLVGLLDISPGDKLRHELLGVGALEVSIA